MRLAAPSMFRELIEAQSVPFAPLEGNPSDLLIAPGMQSALTFNDNPLRGLKHALGYLKSARPVYKQMIENGWQSRTRCLGTGDRTANHMGIVHR